MCFFRCFCQTRASLHIYVHVYAPGYVQFFQCSACTALSTCDYKVRVRRCVIRNLFSMCDYSCGGVFLALLCNNLGVCAYMTSAKLSMLDMNMYAYMHMDPTYVHTCTGTCMSIILCRIATLFYMYFVSVIEFSVMCAYRPLIPTLPCYTFLHPLYVLERCVYMCMCSMWRK